jgi:hypothetical protein
MKPASLLLVAVAIAAGAAAAIGVRNQRGSDDRISGWRGDLEFLAAEARRVHAGPDRPAHSRAFADAVVELSRRIPGLSDRRIAVEFQRLVAMLGDGHSLVYPMPGPRASFSMLPIDVYLFDDGLCVIDGTGPGEQLIGSRIVRFGPRETENILREMEPYVSRDNAMGLKTFAGLFLVQPAFLEAWGGTQESDRVTLTVLDRGGNTRPVTLAAGAARRVRRRLPTPPGTSSPPLYLQQMDREYLTHVFGDRGVLYFRFNQVADAADTTLAAFASRLRDELARTAVDTLIIDVRHNNGGNNMLLGPLLDTISAFASGSSNRRLYVITSRVTFSAAQNFINRLERRVPSVIFAGEPSMSSPNFTGEDNPITLPFSGLTVSISNRYWQDSDQADRRPWIAPHLPVTLTSRDWLDNRDPVLDAILSAITARRAGGR